MKRVGAVITAASIAGVISFVSHQPAQAQAGVCPAGTKEYTVQPGEDLQEIAENHGKGEQEDNGWEEIVNVDTDQRYETAPILAIEKVCVPENWERKS